MADDADRAEERIENTIADGIAECRRKPSMIPCGACYYCGDPVPPHHLFCSSECGTDWHHMQVRNKANGK